MSFWHLLLLLEIFTSHHVPVKGQEDPVPVGLNSKAEACSSLVTPGGTFEKISPSSKYLLFKGNVLSGGEEGWMGDDNRKLCARGEQLEPAEVTNVVDLQSLQIYITSSVWLGLNHKATAGLFKEAGGEEIKFQTFVGMQPNNLNKSERCVMLTPYEGGFLEMEDANCNSVKAAVLCQFKKGSSCYLQSAEETTSSTTTKNDTEVVSLAVGSRFFVSNVQKPWGAAIESCLRQGLQLLTLDEDDINQDISDQIKKRLEEKHLHPATQFWVGGTFRVKDDDYGEDENIDYSDDKRAAHRMFWYKGEDTTVPVVIAAPYQWAQATPDRLEPFDQSGSGMETCLDISFENIKLSSTGTHTPLWRASNCFLPKYFICERVPHGISIDVIKQAVAAASNETNSGLAGRAGFHREIHSCGDLIVDPVNFEIDINRPQTQKDIIKFLIFNVEHDLKSGEVQIDLNEELQVKKTVVDLLVKIVQKSVDSSYVDHGLLNVVKVVILLYLKSTSISVGDQAMWKEKYIPHLESCLNATKMLPVGGTGFEIVYLTSVSDDIIRDTKIHVPEENADNIQNLDSAMDILWYMFSFTIGLCFNLPKTPIQFAAHLHVLFVANFIHELRTKWVINVVKSESSESRGMDYAMALGDFDFTQSYRNLRYLVSAAYISNSIKELQLVRPLDMSKIQSELPMRKDNSKTGSNLKL